MSLPVCLRYIHHRFTAGCLKACAMRVVLSAVWGSRKGKHILRALLKSLYHIKCDSVLIPAQANILRKFFISGQAAPDSS